MFDGLYEKTETTYRVIQTRKDAKKYINGISRVKTILLDVSLIR